MKKVTFTVAMAFLLAMAGNAFATPSADGINSLGEWTAGLIINSFDPNEGGIPDSYDIERVAMFMETGGGGSGNGLYVLIDLYGAPTFTSLDITPPIDPVFYTTALDMNTDGDFTDLSDRIFDFRASGFTVYDGSGSVVAGSPTAVLGSVVEYYIPSGMFASFPIAKFQTFTLLDNAGGPEDDRIPNEGFHTTIPEPASMILFGSGLLGALGFARRKRNLS